MENVFKRADATENKLKRILDNFLAFVIFFGYVQPTDNYKDDFCEI
jgi:hypothetical protein